MKSYKVVKPTLENRNSICPFDFCQLVSMDFFAVEYDQKKEKVLTKQCPICGRRYIHSNFLKDMKGVEIGKHKYYNLNLDEGSIREELVLVSKPGDAQKIYKKKSKVEAEKKAIKKTARSTSKALPDNKLKVHLLTYDTAEGYVVNKKLKRITKCPDPACDKDLEKVHIKYENRRGKIVAATAKKCISCGKYVVPWNVYQGNKHSFKCLNEEYAKEVQAGMEQTQKLPTPEPKKRSRPVAAIKKKISDGSSLGISNYGINSKAEQGNRQKQGNTGGRSSAEIRNINIKDFVIRRTVFKCMHNEHRLKNIDACINIIDKDGNIHEMSVSAGYCEECGLFFIMESVFQRLKIKGTLVCRISDEKAYLKGISYSNGMKLASESLLMQYGYNVSQAEGLTSSRRHKILALLVDNRIMSRNEIISYLDFFINQRQNRPGYEKAIDKWNDDRDFISAYRLGEYTRIGVKGIYRY